MIKISYTPAQLGQLLYKTLESCKKELAKPPTPSIKDLWMKESSLKMLDTLELELREFKKLHPNIKLTVDDLTHTIGLALDVFMKELDIKKN